MNYKNKCPFCGGEVELVEEKVCYGHGDYGDNFYIQCTECYARGPAFDTYMNTEKDPKEYCKRKAIEGWEKRN